MWLVVHEHAQGSNTHLLKNGLVGQASGSHQSCREVTRRAVHDGTCGVIDEFPWKQSKRESQVQCIQRGNLGCMRLVCVVSMRGLLATGFTLARGERATPLSSRAGARHRSNVIGPFYPSESYMPKTNLK